MAVRGEEGRGILRKSFGELETSDEPEMSEWGNPAIEI